MSEEFFTPEEIDEQIDALVSKSEPMAETASSAKQIAERLHQFYTHDPEKYTHTLERAWERIVAEHLLAASTFQEKGKLIPMHDSQEQERQTLNSRRPSSQKRTLVQRLGLLAAVAFIGLLVGGMVFFLNAGHSASNGKGSARLASGGTPFPTPAHPIVGGKCTLDTTVSHPQQSKSDVPGLYIFATNEQSNNLLYRYDVQTKKVVWSKKFCNAFNSNGTIEQNGILYLAGSDITHESDSGTVSYLYALNEADGSVIWGIQFPTTVAPFAKGSPNYGSSSRDFGVIETPTIANGIVYVVQRTGIVYAYNATTGSQLWTFNTGHNAWATTSRGNGSIVDPSSVQVVNGVAYGVSVDRAYALDAQSGKQLWMYSFNNALNINQTLAIDHGTAYLTAYLPGYGTVMHPDTYIYALDAQSGAKKWATQKLTGYINGPVVFNNSVHALSYDGVWYTFNSSNGAVEAQTGLAGSYGGPTLINGVLYNLTSDAANNTLSVLNADGSAKWSAPVSGKFPFIDDVQGGIIYVSGRGTGVYAYSATDGHLLWHYAGYLPQPEGILAVSIIS